MSKIVKEHYLGVFLALFLGVCAFFLSFYLLLGGVVIGIILGIVIGNFFPISSGFQRGITFVEKKILNLSIALMGINLDFTILKALGFKTLFIIVVAMAFTIFVGIVLGKIFKVEKKLTLLLSIGNGVCGGSAIAALSPIIKANKTSIGISIAIVNLLGTLAMFGFIFFGNFFHFSSVDLGVLIGNTLQAVGHVSGAGFAFGEVSGVSATTVKMGRVLLLTPLLFLFILYFSKKEASTPKFPLFILFFIGFSLVGSFDFFPLFVEEFISKASHFLLIVAMVGVGLNIHIRDLVQSGQRSLYMGLVLFLLQIGFTAGLILLF